MSVMLKKKKKRCGMEHNSFIRWLISARKGRSPRTSLSPQFEDTHSRCSIFFELAARCCWMLSVPSIYATCCYEMEISRSFLAIIGLYSGHNAASSKLLIQK